MQNCRFQSLILLLTLAPFANMAHAESSPAGLVARWTGNGTTQDSIGGNRAALAGGATYAPGLREKAFSFNGTDAFVRIPESKTFDFDPSAQFTLEAWVKPETIGHYQAIVVKASGGGDWSWGIMLDPGGRFYSGHNGVDVAQSQTAAQPGRWYDVAVTYNAGVIQMFVNGRLENTAANAPILQSQNGLAIGHKGVNLAPAGSDQDNWFTGLIENVSLYNRVLSDEAISQNYRALAPPERPHPHNLTSYVDTLVGTAGGGNTYPGATVPFGMVQFSPDTQRGGVGYDYGDRQIHGFSMLHMSGVGCADYGDVFMTATTGPIQPDEASYTSPYSHANEATSPGYYAVKLDKSNVKVELAAALRGGMVRFTFPPGQAGNFLLPISHTQVDTNAADVNIVGDREIDGQVTSQGFCGGGSPYTVYYVIQFDRPFAQYGTWLNGVVTAAQRDAHQPDRKTDIGAYATFSSSNGQSSVVTAKIGISFVDLAGARNNLAGSIGQKSFDTVRRDADRDWERALHDIEITGGSTTERTNFYTALYHAMVMPNTFNDADGRYLGFDEKIHRLADGHTLYANYSGWDIYRTQVPLLALIEPARLQDMAQSLVTEYAQDGRFDRWPMANTRTGVMVGEPTTSIQATAWNYGLHGFDMATAYPGMLKAANDYGTRIIEPRGYETDGVSDMQEYCYAISALAQVADNLGKTEDSAKLKTWAEDVFNLYNPATGFFQPRSRTGVWKTPFDPTQGDGYVEGSAWQYLWLVPQDVAGLITRMGGDETFNRRLDQFFSYPRPTWSGQYYNPYNEPDLQAPFLYDFSGQAWKTQSRVRELQKDVYFPAPGGIPGNDDCGTMSAWYVLSSIGLYAVDPGRPVIELTSPLWTKTVVHLQAPYSGKQFTITASGKGSATPYIQSVAVNGQDVDRPWIPVSVLTRGGTLSFRLGANPNTNWGAAENVRPPSLSRE